MDFKARNFALSDKELDKWCLDKSGVLNLDKVKTHAVGRNYAEDAELGVVAARSQSTVRRREVTRELKFFFERSFENLCCSVYQILIAISVGIVLYVPNPTEGGLDIET